MMGVDSHNNYEERKKVLCGRSKNYNLEVLDMLPVLDLDL